LIFKIVEESLAFLGKESLRGDELLRIWLGVDSFVFLVTVGSKFTLVTLVEEYHCKF
jgi:hypothetical protein